MNGTRRFTWQKVLALAPVLMLLASLPGQVLLRCRTDGLLRSSCCCPDASDAADDVTREAAGPTLAAPSCCDRETTSPALPVVEQQPPAHGDAGPIAILLPRSGAGLDPAAKDSRRAIRAHGPPREGPRIVLLKQAFLI
jgi:hypothetical protein